MEQRDGGLQKVANGEALLCCTCHVFQSSMKFVANMTSIEFLVRVTGLRGDGASQGITGLASQFWM